MLEQRLHDFQEIINTLFGDDWDKVVLGGQVFPDGYQIAMYIQRASDDVLQQCSQMVKQGVLSATTYSAAKQTIAQICREEQRNNQLHPEERWTGFTLVIQGKHFSLDYTYNSHMDLLYFGTAWKKKYIQ